MVDEIAKSGEPKFDLAKMPPGLPKPVPQPGDWANNEEAVIDALCDYLDDAAKRGVKRVTRADYRDRQEGVRRGDWPSASTLGRTGPKSFTKWIKKAQPEWQKRAQGEEGGLRSSEELPGWLLRYTDVEHRVRASQKRCVTVVHP